MSNKPKLSNFGPRTTVTSLESLVCGKNLHYKWAGSRLVCEDVFLPREVTKPRPVSANCFTSCDFDEPWSSVETWCNVDPNYERPVLIAVCHSEMISTERNVKGYSCWFEQSIRLFCSLDDGMDRIRRTSDEADAGFLTVRVIHQ